MFHPLLISSLLVLSSFPLHAAQVEALLVATSDQHSSYERTAQFVGRVKQLRADNPAVPMAVLINGDTFEAGNVVAERSGGAIEYAMFTALARCAPTVLNLGNHETEFSGMSETIAKIRATGVVVITDAIDHTTGKPFTSATYTLGLGTRGATVVGLATNHLETYRAAVRPTLEVPDPGVWAHANFPGIFAHASLPIVMSHAGLAADRGLFPELPQGTLLIGGHDHLRFVERRENFVYFHSGSWNECVSVIRLRWTLEGKEVWDVEQSPLNLSDPADPELARMIAATMETYLSPAERERVGSTRFEMSPQLAAQFVVEALRDATEADAAIIGATTFGAGLPRGAVSRYLLNACVRFDGTVYLGEIEGAQLTRLLARTNQKPDTSFSERQGENIVAASRGRNFEAGRTYRLATVDWVVKNQKTYLPETTVEFKEQPSLKLKTIAIGALSRDSQNTE